MRANAIAERAAPRELSSNAPLRVYGDSNLVGTLIRDPGFGQGGGVEKPPRGTQGGVGFGSGGATANPLRGSAAEVSTRFITPSSTDLR